MKYLPAVNDMMVRIAQIEDAITACKYIKKKPGLVQDALRAELSELVQRVEYHAEKSCDVATRTWRF